MFGVFIKFLHRKKPGRAVHERPDGCSTAAIVAAAGRWLRRSDSAPQYACPRKVLRICRTGDSVLPGFSHGCNYGINHIFGAFFVGELGVSRRPCARRRHESELCASHFRNSGQYVVR